MKADLTRDTFNWANHYSRVIMQQGRVTLDADWNEQVAIQLTAMRLMAADIIGPFAGPVQSCGFKLNSTGPGNLTIGAGRYYVDGIQVEVDTQCQYGAQPFYLPPSTDPLLVELGQKTPTAGVYWVYLDVWEWHITWLTDPTIREVALNGPDTCTRTMVVWQVKSMSYPPAISGPGQTQYPGANAGIPTNDPQSCQFPLKDLTAVSTAIMGARVDPGNVVDQPCITPPSSKYRGVENQLYRVEVHEGGTAPKATFKWSRDNGSVVTSLVSQSGNVLTVGQSRGFSSGNWIEMLDDNMDLMQIPGTLVKLAQAGNGTLTVDPNSLAAGMTVDKIYAALDQTANPRVIRWDQTDTVDEPLTNGAVPIVESLATKLSWIDLEDGVQVAFAEKDGEAEPDHVYRTGDYWLIPARVATGDIEWPTTVVTQGVEPVFMPPNGVEHHYAPLGYVTWSGGSFQSSDCTCTFSPIGTCGGTNTPDERLAADDPAGFESLEIAEVKAAKTRKPSAS